MVKNECGQSGIWTLKFTVSQERNDGTSRFFACWYNFTQIKIFEMSLVKNGCGQSGDGTLLKNEQMEYMNRFFAC